MAQAKLIESLDKFLDVLEKSRLFTPEQVKKFRADLAGSDRQPLDIARKLVKNRKLSKWQASQLLAGFHRFRQGQYVLRDQLGKNALGGLFLAHDEKRGQLVVLRSLSKSAQANKEALTAFVALSERAIGLEHEHVARVLEVRCDDQHHALVSEYVKGPDLQSQILEDGPLAATQAVTYLQQAAEALAAAHKKQVIHGGLNPACFMVDGDGVLKITGWGLAPLCNTGNGYSAPDPSDNLPADVRGDVFSLGATLYFWLAGHAPFPDGSDGAPPDEKRQQPQPLADSLPKPLTALCAAMMATDPTSRLAGMSDVQARIAEFGAGGAEPEVVELEEPLDLVEVDEEAAEVEAAEVTEVASALEDDLDSAEPTTRQVEETTAVDSVGPSEQASDSSGAVPKISLGDAHKTAPISDTAAISISTGKGPSTGPVGAFKISTKKKKKKSKGEPAAAAPTAAAPTAAAPAAKAATPDGTAKSSGDAKEDSAQPRRGKTESKAAPAAPTDPDAGEPIADAGPEKKKKKKRAGLPIGLIIGGVALLGLIFLGGGSLLLVLWLSSGDDNVVASADGGGAAEEVVDPEAADPEVDPEEEPDKIVLIDDDPSAGGAADATAVEAGDGGTAESGDAATPAVAAAAGTDVAPPGASPPDPGVDDAASVASPGAAATGEPAAATPAADGGPNGSTDSTQPMPANDAAAVPPADEPADDAKQQADAAAAAKMKADADAAAKKLKEDAAKKAAAEKKKREAALPIFVFEPTIELPALPTAETASEPAVIGKINIGETDVCFISMSGGATASRGRAEFTLQNAKSGTAPRDWEFVVTEAGAQTVVATMALADASLTFQWLPAAIESQYAGGLRNCTLKMTAGSAKPQVLALRSPVVVEPLQVDLTKPSIQTRWNVDALPDPGTLQIVAGMKAQKIVLDPPQPINAARGEQWIFLGDNKATSVLALKLESTVSARGIQVTLKPFLTIPGQKPLAYTKGTKKKVTQELAQRGNLQSKVAFLQDQLKKAPNPQKARVQVMVTQAEQDLQAFDKMAQLISQLDQLEQAYGNAALDFKVTYRTVEGETVLLQTDGA